MTVELTWISVSDSLPEDHHDVLVRSYEGIFAAFREGDHWILSGLDHNETRYLDRIRFWAELPWPAEGDRRHPTHGWIPGYEPSDPADTGATGSVV